MYQPYCLTSFTSFFPNIGKMEMYQNRHHLTVTKMIHSFKLYNKYKKLVLAGTVVEKIK